MLVGLLHEEKEPAEWRRLHVGAEREVSIGSICGPHGRMYCRSTGSERKDLVLWYFRYNTAFMASLDMKTAFDVVKPSVAPKIFPLTGSLAGRNEGRERQRLLGELRDGGSQLKNVFGQEAPVLWGRVAK